MKHIQIVLSFLIILLTGTIYFAFKTQQNTDSHRTNFSGEWKSKESISMGGNIVCTYDSGDRMLAKSMKISQQENYLNIETESSFPGTPLVPGQEKLTFDGKVGQIDHGLERGKKFNVNWSENGKTMTVNSTVHLMVATPFKINTREQMLVYVTEVWNLSDDGKSISIQTKAKSNSNDIERSWKTLFEKVN